MSDTLHVLPRENHLKFIAGGRSTFTVVNDLTENYFTFRVNLSRKDNRKLAVSVMTGSDNECSYSYIGHIWKLGAFQPNLNWVKNPAKVYKATQGSIAFNWIWKHIHNLPEAITVLHAGKCGCCGRKLTTPESIASGIGPICEGR